MNIYPSDTEVRQGFSPAESVAQPQSTQDKTKAATTAPESRSPAQSATDVATSKVAITADRTEAKAAAQKINDQLQANNTTLKIRVLDNSDQGVQAEIVDTKSDKVLRKIPQDELLKLSASIKQMTGVMLNHPA